MKKEFIYREILLWLICALASGVGWIVVYIDPYYSRELSGLLLTAGNCAIVVMVVAYLQPDRPWRWALSSMVIPLVLTALKTESLLDFGVSIAIGIPLFLILLGLAFVSAYIRSKLDPQRTISKPVTGRLFWWFVALLAVLPWLVQLIYPVSKLSVEFYHLTTAAILFLESLAISLWKPTKVWRWAVALTFGFVAITIAKIVFDGIQDPTSHNLWPFEVMYAVIVAGSATFTAAMFVAVLLRLRRTRVQHNSKTEED